MVAKPLAMKGNDEYDNAEDDADDADDVDDGDDESYVHVCICILLTITFQ